MASNKARQRGWLISVRELISTPEKWTKGASARDKDGEACFLENSKATCFCISGAWGKLRLSTPMSSRENTIYNAARKQLLAQIINHDCDAPIVYFNDDPNTTHTMVMDLFDKAIATA